MAPRSTAADDVAVGAVPATPIMHWLSERGGPLSRFSQAMLLAVPGGLIEDDLAARACGAGRASRCAAASARCGGGGWRLEIPPEGPSAPLLRRVDVRGLDDQALDGQALDGEALRARIAAGGGGCRAAARSGGRPDAAGGVVRCRGGAVRAAASVHPSSCGRRGVVADPGAGPGGGVAPIAAGSRPGRRWRCRRGAPRSGAGRRGLPCMRGARRCARSCRSGAGSRTCRRCS